MARGQRHRGLQPFCFRARGSPGRSERLKFSMRALRDVEKAVESTTYDNVMVHPTPGGEASQVALCPTSLLVHRVIADRRHNATVASSSSATCTGCSVQRAGSYASLPRPPTSPPGHRSRCRRTARKFRRRSPCSSLPCMSTGAGTRAAARRRPAPRSWRARAPSGIFARARRARACGRRLDVDADAPARALEVRDQRDAARVRHVEVQLSGPPAPAGRAARAGSRPPRARCRASARASTRRPRARRRSGAQRVGAVAARALDLLGRERRPQRGHRPGVARERAPPHLEVPLGRGQRPDRSVAGPGKSLTLNSGSSHAPRPVTGRGALLMAWLLRILALFPLPVLHLLGWWLYLLAFYVVRWRVLARANSTRRSRRRRSSGIRSCAPATGTWARR